jgi:nicotinamide-nucleotide amidase
MTIEDLARRLTVAGLTVAVAESASGGLIAAELSRVSGSSAYFKGAVVAYDSASKTDLLGIAPSILQEHGSVSPEACTAMAQAARRLFQADLGLAETGIAGPGGATPGKPVGLSYVALATARGSQVEEHHLKGSRNRIRQAIKEEALRLLAAAIR